MNLWQKFLRAEYQWQPLQLGRRAWRILRRVRSRHRARVLLPWRLPILINPRESIGLSIVALNTLDLPVTEAIWRLVDPAATCADVGANIGYMTSIMAARARTGGSIHSFEPVPELADELERNVREWRALTNATIRVHRIALAEKCGPVSMQLPGDFEANRGLGMLAGAAPVRAGPANFHQFTVNCERLDDVFATVPHLDLVKVDVEGGEHLVFAGAEKLLHGHRIRDIVFEEYSPARSAPSIRIVRDHGYEVFFVARSIRGPLLQPADTAIPDDIDPPTYVATADPARAKQRFAARGWHALRG